MRTRIYLFFLLCFCGIISVDLFGFPAVQENLTLQLSKADSDSSKINILGKLANSYIEDDMNICLEYAAEMINLINKLPYENKKGAYYASAALIFLDCHVYDRALDLLLRASNLFEKSNDFRSITVIKNNIGGVYLRLGRKDLALKYFTEGLDESQNLIAIGDSSFISKLHAYYNNIGLIYTTDGAKKPLAGTYLEKAIETVSPNDYLNLGTYYNNIALYYYEIGKKEKAFQCAEKSMEYRKMGKNEHGITRTNYTLAYLYYEEKNFKKSKEYLTEAQITGEKINSMLILQGVYDLFVRIYENENDFQKANSYIKKSSQVHNRLINDTILVRTATMKLEYEFARKSDLQQIEIQKTNLRLRLTLYIIGLLVVVIALLFFLVRSRNKRIQLENISLEKDLETRNKELTTNVMYLMRNTDLISEVTERLIKLKTRLKAEDSNVLKEIIMNLESLMKNDLWSEFETHFNRVHLDFYKKLTSFCSELTPTELKLCAFLRLNMSSKEISSISGITVKSVEVMRGRIRKKLNIANTDINLITFLAEF